MVHQTLNSSLINGDRVSVICIQLKLMRRTTVGNAMWIPKPSDRVCANNFVEKEPTPGHPDPTIHPDYGYDFVPTQV